MSAAHNKLDNLVGILDYNGLQIDGRNEDVMTVAPVAEKFRAFGWNTVEIDGHDFDEILGAFKKARLCKGKPTMIIARTVREKAFRLWKTKPDGTERLPTMNRRDRLLKNWEVRCNGRENGNETGLRKSSC